jgi:4-hydroxy-2-oxoheptanedioate aldolase
MTVWFSPCLIRGTIKIGTFVQVPYAGVVEYLATLPFDFLCLEAEHSPFEVYTINAAIAAAEQYGMPCLVRVAGLDPIHIKQALDAGAAGIVVPCIETAEQVRTAVSAARFPPQGRRGCGPGRATAYGRDIVEYVRQADKHTAVIIQIETRAAVDNLKDILSVEGVDMFFIGPGDLSIAYREAAGDDPVDPAPIVERVLEQCKSAGKRVATFAGTVDGVQKAEQQGLDAVIFASDIMFTGLGASQALSSVGRATTGLSQNGAATFAYGDMTNKGTSDDQHFAGHENAEEC